MSDAADGRGWRRRVDQVTQRLRRSAALLLATRERHHVVETVAQSPTDEDAVEAVSELLDVSAESAAEIVDMPVRAFTEERVRDREQEVERLKGALVALRSDCPRP